ncbi:hypothetical protein [Ramlibacter sp. WS9]|uniref:hypothetical protein n=1 Tax=Ramlibacter sp. WS9 TaxID=1882741 RepID=UPI0011420E7A|nr:hypothetical protein [Ramlibacter sp. WS9]ROZ78679.1 hypothetical protein EEB15_03025 [Ramlibacter sp. WS9]
MDLMFGPFNGCRVVVSVVQADGPQGSFSASYQIYANGTSPDATSAPVLGRTVAGAWASADEASDIALQIARLQIAGLRSHVAQAATQEQRKASNLAEFAASWDADGEHEAHSRAYQPTLPCPLMPMASLPS